MYQAMVALGIQCPEDITIKLDEKTMQPMIIGPRPIL